jgi:hypothetical protein
MKVFCSGSCRLLTTFANKNNIDAIHTLYGPYFDGTNFIGKYHDTKQHIQFIRFLKGEIDFDDNDIRKRILTCYNYEKWNRHGILESMHTIPNKIANLRNQIDNCDIYIFEICSLKIYNYKGFYTQYEQMPNNDISDYNVVIQDKLDLFNDLFTIKNLFPNKKIIFQCHFRPNVIYNDETKAISKRETIYEVLLKFCNDNENCFLYDPSRVLIDNNNFFDGDNHFYENGYNASFKYLCDNYIFI